MVMLDAGVKRETIDAAAEDFGMPVGPDRARRRGRSRHPPACRRNPASAGLAAHDARYPPQWLQATRSPRASSVKQDRQGRSAWRGGRAVKARKKPRSRRPPARRPTASDSADARCLRDRPARGRSRRRGAHRRRHDIRHRICAVPRRTDALRPLARGRGRAAPRSGAAVAAAYGAALQPGRRCWASRRATIQS